MPLWSWLGALTKERFMKNGGGKFDVLDRGWPFPMDKVVIKIATVHGVSFFRGVSR